MSSTSWSDLPPDILHAISTRLPSYLFFLRLRAVSHHFLSSLPQPLPPPLLLQPTLLRLLPPLARPVKSHPHHHPPQRPNLPPLSTFPNVVSLDFSNFGREYTLQNRFGLVYTLSLHQMRDAFLKKIVLSSTPRSREGFAVMPILSQNGELGYCRNGGKEWSIVEGVELCCVDGWLVLRS